MAKSVFRSEPFLHMGLATIFQEQELRKPYVHVEACSKDPPRVNLSGHRGQKEMTSSELHFQLSP